MLRVRLWVHLLDPKDEEGQKVARKLVNIMGRFEDTRNEKKERVERDFKVREKLAGFFFDLAKLVFAAMVLVGGVSIITGEPTLSQALLVIFGLFFTSFIALIGYKILKY